MEIVYIFMDDRRRIWTIVVVAMTHTLHAHNREGTEYRRTYYYY